MASFLGVSEPTLDKRVRAGLPGRKREGVWEFDTAKVIEWLIKDALKGAGTPNKKAEIDLRIMDADAELKEYKVAETRRTFLHVDDILPLFEEQTAIVKSKITALPARLAQSLALEQDPAEVLRLLKKEVNEILADMSAADIPKAKQQKPGWYDEGGGGWVPPAKDEGPEEGGAPAAPAPLTEDGY